jgi:hypothetical protein
MTHLPLAGPARLLRHVALALLLAGCAAEPPRNATSRAAAPRPAAPVSRAAAPDVTPRSVHLLQPGTVVGDDGPPQGWTNLVIKSHPHLGDADRARVADATARLSGFLFTSMVANVQPEPGANPPHYRLADVAVGVGTAVHGRDTVLSPDTRDRLGANLSFLAGIVFSMVYEGQKDVRTVASSGSFMVIDTPSVMKRGERNSKVHFRYALLVDAPTGRLDVLVWLIDRDKQGNNVAVNDPAEALPPNKLEDAVLHLDDTQYTVLPTELAFGVLHVPQGQARVSFPDALKAVASKPQLTAAEAEQMEASLRGLLAAPVAASVPRAR